MNTSQELAYLQKTSLARDYPNLHQALVDGKWKGPQAMGGVQQWLEQCTNPTIVHEYQCACDGKPQPRQQSSTAGVHHRLQEQRDRIIAQPHASTQERRFKKRYTEANIPGRAVETDAEYHRVSAFVAQTSATEIACLPPPIAQNLEEIKQQLEEYRKSHIAHPAALPQSSTGGIHRKEPTIQRQADGTVKLVY